METNLAKLAEQAFERFGDYPSLCFEGEWHTSGRLRDRAARVGGGLREHGIKPGDRVIVIMANCPEVVIVYEALWRNAAIVTPVVFLVTPPELRHIIDDSGAVAVLTTPEFAPKVDAALDGRPDHERPTVWVVGDSFGELETAVPGPIVDCADDELAALLYTGGTTGRSKGVALSHANLSNAGASSRAVSHVQGLTRGISGLPLSHSFGILVTVGGMHAPEPLVSILQRWFEPAGWLRLAAEHHAQTTAVVPSMLAILLSQPLEEYDLSSLRFVFSGAAPLPPAVRDEFTRRVPSATVVEGYGCTETGGIISSTPPMAPKPGTVGRAVPGVEIRIAGSDGADVPLGTDGEIVVHGANIMSHYWGGDQLPGGWFPTGDVGRLDADGYLTIIDRIKDLILRGGFNVYPRDVEDALMTHPDVAMAAVVGRPHPLLGEEVVAYVALAAGSQVKPEELIEHARERVGAHKYPREVNIIDAIPLTSVGKLDRKRLRALASSVELPTAVVPPTAEPRHRLSVAEWKGVAKRTLAQLRAHNLTDLAAALTYYAVLSIFPGLLVLVSVLRLFGADTPSKVVKNLSGVAPGGADSTINGAVDSLQRASGGGAVLLVIVSLIGALWSASGYVAAFMRAANTIVGVPEGRPLWKTVPLRLGMTVLAGVTLTVAAFTVIFTGAAARHLGDTIGIGPGAVTAWDIAKWPVLVIIISLLLAVMYWVSPNAKVGRFRVLSAGSVLAVVVWLIASGLFGFYVANFGSYNKVYGSIASVIVFLVWLWITNLAILLGAELDSAIRLSRAIRAGVSGQHTPYVQLRDASKAPKTDTPVKEA